MVKGIICVLLMALATLLMVSALHWAETPSSTGFASVAAMVAGMLCMVFSRVVLYGKN